MCRLCEEAPFGYCDCGCGKPRGKNGCTAHSSRSKVLCNSKPLKGRHVCAIHGGKTPRGADSPHWKHGKYSIVYKEIPKRYVEAAVRSLESPESKSNRHQIALIDARSDELIGGLSTGEHGEAWVRASSAAGRLKKAFYAGDVNGVSKGLVDLEKALESGRADAEIWRQLIDLFEQRRKSVDTDSRIAFRKSVAMSLDEALQLASIVISAAREFIDTDDLDAFAERVAAMTPGGADALMPILEDPGALTN
jgi:hypothetical protein